MKRSSGGHVNKGQQSQGLQGLPVEVLDAVLSQLDESSRLQVFRTSKLLATALLRVLAWIKLTYPTPHDFLGPPIRELAPFLTEVLRSRQQPKLHLTLQPVAVPTDAMWEYWRAEPAAAVVADAASLVAMMLKAVPLCGAVDSLAISWHYDFDLPWEPEFSTALAASFPSLTSLTLQKCSMSIGHLANAINPLLLPRLLHLDLEYASITHEGQPGSSPFIGSRLQELCLHGVDEGAGGREFLYGLLPLPPTLTQLEVINAYEEPWDWVRLAAAVSSLTQLQQLRLTDESRGWYKGGPGLSLLPALAHLPSLHTLVVDELVVGQEQLDALLALTQITSLQVAAFSGLTSSRASAACSWRQLEVHTMDWVTAAYLPLHSLTHPLHLTQLVGYMMEGVEEGDIEEPSIEVLAQVQPNLCERNKAGLVLEWPLCLSKASVDLLTERYLSHSRRTAQQPPHPTVASSSSPEGHITPGGPGSSRGQGVQQGGSAAGAQPLMQRLGHYVEAVRITGQGLSEECLSSDNRQALAVLFPKAHVSIAPPWWNTA
ncbi:hypothetical protein QJQ45_010694 [Haematococcus lacustris]|nr:hypothetical protein QJQ45_010694 [Haematococcus lacustris]